MAATFLLVRHAAHDDLGIRLSGRRAGVGLSPEGRLQAQVLGHSLAAARPQRVVSSPLDRTMATARIVSDGLALRPPEAVEALIEIDFGDWTGRRLDSFGDDTAWRAWNEQRHRARPPGGESMAQAQARIVGWMTAAASMAPDETIVAVTHSDMIRAAVAHVLGLTLDKLLRFDIDPASITTVVMGDWGARLLSLNVKGT